MGVVAPVYRRNEFRQRGSKRFPTRSDKSESVTAPTVKLPLGTGQAKVRGIVSLLTVCGLVLPLVGPLAGATHISSETHDANTVSVPGKWELKARVPLLMDLMDYTGLCDNGDVPQPIRDTPEWQGFCNAFSSNDPPPQCADHSPECFVLLVNRLLDGASQTINCIVDGSDGMDSCTDGIGNEGAAPSCGATGLCFPFTDNGKVKVHSVLAHGTEGTSVTPPQVSPETQRNLRAVYRLGCALIGAINPMAGLACVAATEAFMIYLCADGRCDPTLTFNGYFELEIDYLRWTSDAGSGRAFFMSDIDDIRRYVNYKAVDPNNMDQERVTAYSAAQKLGDTFMALPPHAANGEANIPIAPGLQLNALASDGLAFLSLGSSGDATAYFNGPATVFPFQLFDFIDWTLELQATGPLDAGATP